MGCTWDQELTFFYHLADKYFCETGHNLGDGLGNLLAQMLLYYLKRIQHRLLTDRTFWIVVSQT